MVQTAPDQRAAEVSAETAEQRAARHRQALLRQRGVMPLEGEEEAAPTPTQAELDVMVMLAHGETPPG